MKTLIGMWGMSHAVATGLVDQRYTLVRYCSCEPQIFSATCAEAVGAVSKQEIKDWGKTDASTDSPRGLCHVYLFVAAE